MTVVFFNRSYWPDVTATGQLLTEMAEDMVARHGCEVTVVTGYPRGGDRRLRAREVRNGVTIIRASGTTFDKRRFAGRASNYVTYFLSACVAGFRVGRPDVVVAMTDPPIIGLAGLLCARWHRARFVFRCCDVFPEVAVLLEDFHSAWVDRALEATWRFLLARADLVVALGATMRQRLLRKGADPARTIVREDWADCEALHPAPKDNAFSRAHQLQDRFVVMHAGNIGLSQNLDVFVDAAARLRHREDIRFVMVGEGARKSALEAQASARGLGNIDFLPYQPRQGMVDSYAAADVFLVSLKPGLAGVIVPSKMYSILAAGRPYVAAVEEDCELVALTREHQCGVVIAPGDGAALAGAVERLASDRAGAEAMGRRAREAALLFDRPRMIGAFVEAIGRV
ncbi:MAG: glycosyltransferase family 4 protein [Vicinamibacterales bacterium]|nr:glycosyltransferase family 4 protein [Vicinamibacterales bacterium]